MQNPDTFGVIAFLFAAFIPAGIAQTIWLKSNWSKRFAKPLDRGRMVYGHRVFGENKTWRGFIVMVPSVGIMFALASFLQDRLGIWPLSVTAYFFLGCWVGLAFMLGELPNSFLKRQWGVAPGAAPRSNIARVVCFVVDQIDSLLAALIALAVFVPVPLGTWVITLVLGLIVHWLFNVVLKVIGVKQRAA